MLTKAEDYTRTHTILVSNGPMGYLICCNMMMHFMTEHHPAALTAVNGFELRGDRIAVHYNQTATEEDKAAMEGIFAGVMDSVKGAPFTELVAEAWAPLADGCGLRNNVRYIMRFDWLPNTESLHSAQVNWFTNSIVTVHALENAAEFTFEHAASFNGYLVREGEKLAGVPEHSMSPPEELKQTPADAAKRSITWDTLKEAAALIKHKAARTTVRDLMRTYKTGILDGQQVQVALDCPATVYYNVYDLLLHMKDSPSPNMCPNARRLAKKALKFLKPHYESFFGPKAVSEYVSDYATKH